MQWLFRFLTLISLMVAPLAAPAAAKIPAVASAADCEKMDMSASDHRTPVGHHDADERCCVAVPAAINVVPPALSFTPPLDHPALIAVVEAFFLGAGPKADDPPPRTA